MSEQRTLRWTPPTENTDGTPITQPLDYELGRVIDGEIRALYSVVGTLQDGEYVAPLEQSDLETGVEHTFHLRAINRRGTNEVDDDLYSEWSNGVTVILSNGVPNPPENFSIA